MPWNGFGTSVIQYWNGISQHDKQANVTTQGEYSRRYQRVGNSSAENEGLVKALVGEFIEAVHSAAANGLNGTPRPTDRHSKLQRWEHGVEVNAQAGVPNFAMVTEYGNILLRVTAMIEVKNPWQVTPARIDEVIRGIFHHSVLPNLLYQVPLSGQYPARLALEQLYGYMVRNAKEYGILTTMRGWCFLR